MKNRKLRFAFLAVALALGLVATGCLLSGQFIILYNVDANIHSADDVLGSAHIDLTTEDIWELPTSSSKPSSLITYRPRRAAKSGCRSKNTPTSTKSRPLPLASSVALPCRGTARQTSPLPNHRRKLKTWRHFSTSSKEGNSGFMESPRMSPSISPSPVSMIPIPTRSTRVSS